MVSFCLKKLGYIGAGDETRCNYRCNNEHFLDKIKSTHSCCCLPTLLKDSSLLLLREKLDPNSSDQMKCNV